MQPVLGALLLLSSKSDMYSVQQLGDVGLLVSFAESIVAMVLCLKQAWWLHQLVGSWSAAVYTTPTLTS